MITHCCYCLAARYCLTLQARILEWIAISFSRESPNPGSELTSPTLAGEFFTTEPINYKYYNTHTHTHTHTHIYVWLSHVWLFATPWTVACQAPLSMGFSKQDYWGGLPCPPPGDLPDPGIELRSPASQAGSSPSEPPETPGPQSREGVGKKSLPISPTSCGKTRSQLVRMLTVAPSSRVSSWGWEHMEEIQLGSAGAAAAWCWRDFKEIPKSKGREAPARQQEGQNSV